MSNRVEELESTVRELRAAVDGLTEELVETRERLRQLEEQRAAEPEPEVVESAHAEHVDAEAPADADGDAQAEADEESGDEAEADDDADDTDEIIVA
ncbi:MAG: hypothetical protein A07HB70_00183 [uncultured archaeon A07HB70]|jgi:hypothetical protein|nr:MAG: hypothetical protein A07HB70_00183 [uncultured archaeon A07HB70]